MNKKKLFTNNTTTELIKRRWIEINDISTDLSSPKLVINSISPSFSFSSSDPEDSDSLSKSINYPDKWSRSDIETNIFYQIRFRFPDAVCSLMARLLDSTKTINKIKKLAKFDL